MPLANYRGLVAFFLEKLGKRLLVAIKNNPIYRKTIDVAVLSRLNHRPTGSTNGIRHIATIEHHPFFRQSVHVWRRNTLGVIRTQCLLAVIIGEYKNNIGTIACSAKSQITRQGSDSRKN